MHGSFQKFFFSEQPNINVSRNLVLLITLYRETGRSDFAGGNQSIVTAILSPIIKVSPSVKFEGGPGLLGSRNFGIKKKQQNHLSSI